MTQVNKVNPRKEFFRLSIRDLKHQVEVLGIAAAWTMAANAAEYRESLAIEAKLKDNECPLHKTGCAISSNMTSRKHS